MKVSTPRYILFSFIGLCLFFIGGCFQNTDDSKLQEQAALTEPLPVQQPEKLQEQDREASVKTDLTVIGEVEPVTIVAPKLTMPARIDTGATTSSLDAQDIKKFERDGKPWVRFSVKDRKTGKISQLETPLARIVEIKRHGGEPQMRPVAKLKVKLGKTVLSSEFSLTDRSLFEYPILIGRNVLEGLFVVDVSRKNSTALMAEDPEHEN